MANKNITNELSEILATALAGKPELNERLSSLLGRRSDAAPPGKVEEEMTMKDRRNRARLMFTRLHLKEKLKQAV